MIYLIMFKEDFLQVSKLHKIYYATAGNRKGIPLLKIHGGPGGSCKTDFFNYIDLNKFFVIIYDQRGCGKSIPNGELTDNNTNELIEDINKILIHLNIEKVVINSASWGSCLALLFAEKYPQKIIKLFLNSVFLANKENCKWFYEYSKNIFPDIYEKYMSFIPANVKNKSKYLFKQIQSKNINKRKLITYNIVNYEMCISSNSFMTKEFIKFEDIDANAINSSKIFLYYESNNCFIEDNYILKNSKSIENIPMAIYHGRLDMCSTFFNIYQLKKKLLNVKFNIIHNENHCGPLQKQLTYCDINNM